MYSAKELLNIITSKELVDVLEQLMQEDCYLEDFIMDDFSNNFLHMLESYNLAFVSSDGRVLVTSTGEKTLLTLASTLI